MEAELKFEREKRSGVAVVGGYLIDAARRLGIEVEAECGRMGLCDSCAVKITGGRECLSGLTKAETEQLSEERRKQGERLACQAKIEKSGEIVIMTHEKKDDRSEEERRHEEFRKEFDALPLEKKIARLLELEAVALGETFSYILNSPYLIGEKVVDLMAQFGIKFDQAAKSATRPEEHKQEEGKQNGEAKAETGQNPTNKKTQTGKRPKPPGGKKNNS